MTTRLTLMALLLIGFSALADDSKAKPEPVSKSTVGMPAKIDQIVLPGTLLEVKPIEDRREPVVLRIVDSYPHGSAFRYDLVYYTLEPGEYDLRNCLRRKDGSPLGELPAIPVSVSALLPPGQIEPHPIALEPSPWLGGYRFLIGLGGSLWAAGLAYILLKSRRDRVEAFAETAPPPTLGDRLRPLVSAALDGTLGEPQRAELERLLIGYWRKRLGLEHERPAVAMAVMRDHPEAGPLLHSLEDWLHRPESERRMQGDELAVLLRPYLDAPDSVVEADSVDAIAGESAS